MMDREIDQNTENHENKTIVHEKYQSIQDIVFSALRTAILNGELKPGEKLTTAELADRYGVSRTPVRESLTRLKSIGLIETFPHRGAFVKKLSIEEIIQIFYIRGALSGIAARMALPNLTKKDTLNLLAICDQMESKKAAQSHEFMLELNSRFHNFITSAAKSPMIEDLLGQFYRMSSSYRALGLELPGRELEVCKEHRNIAESLHNRDCDKAEFYSREHYFNTARRIAKSLGHEISI